MKLFRDCEGFHRRDFLKIGAAGALGLTLPQILQLEALAKRNRSSSKAKADAVILVWQAGGPSHLDTWDPKPDAPEGIRGEYKPINTSAKGVQISEHLPKIAKVADKISIVRSLYHTIPSHGTATVWMTTGNKPTPALQYPALGSITAKMLSTTPGAPPFVSFGQMRRGTGLAGYLGTAYNPFIIEGRASTRKGRASSMRVRGIQLPNGFTLEQLKDRDELRKGFEKTFRQLDKEADLIDGMDAYHRQALEILRSDKTKKAFDLDKEKETIRNSYGLDTFGQGLLTARRLVEAGVRFVTITTGGWDTHNQNFDRLKKRNLPPLDRSVSALINDLSQRGMLDRTVVMVAGEFGRTPKVNKKSGRDHWARSMAMMIAGGGFKQGYVHGSTDNNGMAPATQACRPDDVAATLFHQLGIDPKAELMTPSNRPIQLFREGTVIEKLIS